MMMKPFKIHPSQARAYFGIKKKANEEMNVKQAAFERVKDLFPAGAWRIKRTGVLHDNNYDIVDSFVVAHCSLKMYRERRLSEDRHLRAKYTEFYMQATSTHCGKQQNGRESTSEEEEEDDEKKKKKKKKNMTSMEEKKVMKKKKKKVNEEAELEEKIQEAFREEIVELSNLWFPAPCAATN